MVNDSVTSIHYATGVFGYVTHPTAGLSAEGKV